MCKATSVGGLQLLVYWALSVYVCVCAYVDINFDYLCVCVCVEVCAVFWGAYICIIEWLFIFIYIYVLYVYIERYNVLLSGL